MEYRSPILYAVLVCAAWIAFFAVLTIVCEWLRPVLQ